MSNDRTGARRLRLTARGAATRARILTAAADLIYTQGVAGTSLDDVMAASGTGRSQLYHYFADKDDLVVEVAAAQVKELLATQGRLLGRLDSLRGLQRWRDAQVIDIRSRHGAYGCPIGSLASELADRTEPARLTLAAGFATWQAYLSAGFGRMQDKGELSHDADPAALALAVLAALEGGMLLARASRDITQLEIALDMALRHVASYVLDPVVKVQ